MRGGALPRPTACSGPCESGTSGDGRPVSCVQQPTKQTTRHAAIDEGVGVKLGLWGRRDMRFGPRRHGVGEMKAIVE